MATTKAVDLTDEIKEAGGNVSWGAQKLSFIATLFASKTGKSTGFSDKRYKVAVLVVKPTFGTSKTQLKEVASCEVNISDYAAVDQPRPLTLQLDRRAHDGNPVVLHLTLVARQANSMGDDDDDEQSISSAITGFSGLPPEGSEAPSGDPHALEQDLEGFAEVLAGQGQGLFKKTLRPPPLHADTTAEGAGSTPAVFVGAGAAVGTGAKRLPPTPFDEPDDDGGKRVPPTPFDEPDDNGGSAHATDSTANPFGAGPMPPPPLTSASAAADRSKGSMAKGSPMNPFGRPSDADGTRTAVTAAAAAAATSHASPFDRDVEAEFGEDAAEGVRVAAGGRGVGETSCNKTSTNPFGGSSPSAAKTGKAATGTAAMRAAAVASSEGDGVSRPEQMDRDELVALREELSFAGEQLRRAQDEARAANAEAQRAQEEAKAARELAGERKNKLAAELATIQRLRDERQQRDEQAAATRAKLEVSMAAAEAAKVAALAEAEALRTQLDEVRRDVKGGSRDHAASESAIEAAAAAAAAAATAAAAEELALLRAEAAGALRQAAQAEERAINVTNAAEERAAETEEELEQLRDELDAALGRLEKAEATAAHGGGDGGSGSGRFGSGSAADDASAELEQMSHQLIEAKMAAAQNAYERDEARADAKRLGAELERVGGGTRKLGQHATKLEVKYDELRRKYDADLASLIDVRLQAAEHKARADELEKRLRKL